MSSIVDSYFHRREELAAQVDEEFKDAGEFTLERLSPASEPRFKSLSELQKWVDLEMSSAERFFAPSDNTDKFELDEHQLVFSSSDPVAMPTDTVPIKVFGIRHLVRRSVVIVPHWNAKTDSYDMIARLLAFTGYAVFVLTLPHHGARSKNPNAPVANAFLNADLMTAILAVRQSVRDARRLINWIHERRANEIHIVGVSLGSCVASLVSAFEPRLTSSSLLLTAGDFAEVVWTGRATKHIRTQMDGKIDLPQLKKAWSIISPSSYLSKFSGSAALLQIISARRDEVVRFDLSERFVEELRSVGVKVAWEIVPCGHYTVSSFPFSWYSFALLVKFILRAGQRRSRGG